MSEPSKFAVEAADLFVHWNDYRGGHGEPGMSNIPRNTAEQKIQHAIDQACAEKELKLGDADRINNELCVLITEKEKRIAEMAMILQYMPHAPDEQQAGDAIPGQEPCAANCPRCAWERLKCS